MKRKVCILLGDAYLKRKLELILSDVAVFTEKDSADIIFADSYLSLDAAKIITVGRGDEYMLRVPFSDSEAFALLPNGENSAYGISVVGQRIFLGEREIRLTELESALFMKLYDARGEFVSREELFSVFAEGSSKSMLNVYVHYLREKLEQSGMRVIISSRKLGYKIDEKFFL